jgi:predicted Zn-dependent protease
MLVSESQEIQIGKEASPSLRWEFGGEYHDRSLELYLGDIVSRLWQISERPHLPVKFSIQNTSLPNAFAIPGYVAITRGLLSDMENEAQFAAVMGHEIGHVMGRHTAQRISRVQLQQMGLAIGASALEGTSGGDALLQIGAIGSSLCRSARLAAAFFFLNTTGARNFRLTCRESSICPCSVMTQIRPRGPTWYWKDLLIIICKERASPRDRKAL